MELYYGAIEQNFEVIVPSSITGLIVKLGYTPIRKLYTMLVRVFNLLWSHFLTYFSNHIVLNIRSNTNEKTVPGWFKKKKERKRDRKRIYPFHRCFEVNEHIPVNSWKSIRWTMHISSSEAGMKRLSQPFQP